MRAGVIIDGVEMPLKQEFIASPVPGDVIAYAGGEAIVKRLQHRLESRQAFVVCETDKAVLAVSVDQLRLAAMREAGKPQPADDAKQTTEETTTETPAEASPTQAIRRSGKRRPG